MRYCWTSIAKRRGSFPAALCSTHIWPVSYPTKGHCVKLDFENVTMGANRTKTCRVYGLKTLAVSKCKWFLDSFRPKVILPKRGIDTKTRKQIFNPRKWLSIISQISAHWRTFFNACMYHWSQSSRKIVRKNVNFALSWSSFKHCTYKLSSSECWKVSILTDCITEGTNMHACSYFAMWYIKLRDIRGKSIMRKMRSEKKFFFAPFSYIYLKWFHYCFICVLSSIWVNNVTSFENKECFFLSSIFKFPSLKCPCQVPFLKKNPMPISIVIFIWEGWFCIQIIKA